MARRLIIVICLSLALLTSCENDKKNLEKAKTEISELKVKNQQLSDLKVRLESENSALAQEMAQIRDKNTALAADIEQFKKNLSDLTQQNEGLQKKNEVAGAQIAQLNKLKDELKAKISDLSKKVAPNPEHINKFTQSGQEAQTKLDKELSPCDALLEYMAKCRSIVQNFKGGERKSKLEETFATYQAKMKDAPPPGRMAAIDWVKELNRSWDRRQDDKTPRLMRLKNAALKACGKTAKDAGF
ncbi:MAG: hypothetical protein ACP5U1_04260 [Desulfomonilaceae bacterium]